MLRKIKFVLLLLKVEDNNKLEDKEKLYIYEDQT